MNEVPSFAMRAYALLYTRHGAIEQFGQSELDWIVSEPMRKKIFATLMRAGWLRKAGRRSYYCVEPATMFKNMLRLRVPELIKEAKVDYAFTGLSAVEVWSDYSYVQRGIEKSPYFVKVLKKDLQYWKDFFNINSIPNYVGRGTTVGEYVILIPVEKFDFVEKGGIKVEPLKKTMREASQNDMFSYAYDYLKRKYGAAA